jgi:hypothetical protein
MVWLMRTILSLGALVCAVIGTFMLCDVVADLLVSFRQSGVGFGEWLSFLFEDPSHIVAVPIILFLLLVPFIPALIFVKGSKMKVSLLFIAVLEAGFIALFVICMRSALHSGLWA